MIVLSTAASAQMATTNCMAMGSMVNCNTIGGGGGDDHSLEILANAIHNASEASVRSKIGKMVAAGQCQEARDYALKKGRLEMASSVERLCSGQSAQSAPAVTITLPPAPQPARPTPLAMVSQPRSQAATGGLPGLNPYQEGRLFADIQMQKQREANPNE